MYLYGASGHAKVILDILESNNIVVDGLIDDNDSIEELMGYPVYHSVLGDAPLIISIGSNKVRKAIAERFSGMKYGTAVHPSAIVSKHALVGEGTVVMQGAIIQSCAEIGKHCIVNTGASVDHECIIGDYVHQIGRAHV